MNTSDSIDVDAAKQTLVKLLAIADRLDARNLQTAEHLDAAVSALDQSAQQLDKSGDAFAQRALAVIGSSARQSILQATDDALHQVRERLQHSADGAQAAAQALARESRALASARRGLVWNGLIALLVGCLLAAGGAAWIAHKSMQEVARAQFAQDILQAVQRGTLTRCGDSLCAKVGSKPQRYDKDSRYLLLQE